MVVEYEVVVASGEVRVVGVGGVVVGVVSEDVVGVAVVEVVAVLSGDVEVVGECVVALVVVVAVVLSPFLFCCRRRLHLLYRFHIGAGR